MAVVLSWFWIEATIHARGFRRGIGSDMKAQYFGLWSNLIYCFWRVSRGNILARADTSSGSDQEEGDSNSDSDSTSDKCNKDPLFRGTRAQQEAFDRCLEATVNENENALRQHVLAFSMAFIQQDLPRNRFDSPVLSYCAMLAVNHNSQGWKLPGNYNSFLSGMIYCAQLWIFREACQLVDEKSGRSLDDVFSKVVSAVVAPGEKHDLWQHSQLATDVVPCGQAGSLQQKCHLEFGWVRDLLWGDSYPDGADHAAICEFCEVQPTVYQSYENSCDRKGIRGYSFTSLCEQCWQGHNKAEREKEKEKERTLALNKARVDSMMNIVQNICSTEQNPIARAVDRLMSEDTAGKNLRTSRRWFQRHLIYNLSQELQIVKRRNKYIYNKHRVDAMNLKL